MRNAVRKMLAKWIRLGKLCADFVLIYLLCRILVLRITKTGFECLTKASGHFLPPFRKLILLGFLIHSGEFRGYLHWLEWELNELAFYALFKTFLTFLCRATSAVFDRQHFDVSCEYAMPERASRLSSHDARRFELLGHNV